MSVYSPDYHAMVIVPGPAGRRSRARGRDASRRRHVRTQAQDEGFFHHLLDVINPLQHLPVIGTIYRAITGEHIGPIEKIAGDTLYGGMWGAVSSVADVAFEGITGKSFEDTALAWFKGDDKTQVASTKVERARHHAPNISLPSADHAVAAVHGHAVASPPTPPAAWMSPP